MRSNASVKFFASIVLAGSANAGQAQDCSAPTTAGIKLTSGISEPVVLETSYTRTARELTREAAPDKSLAEQPGQFETINGLTFGVTRSGLSYSFRTGVYHGVSREGTPCARLISVDYYLRLSPVKVSLAKELEGLACLSPRVQSHEDEHVRIFVRMLKDEDAKRKIHEKLKYAVARISVVVGNDKSTLHDEMDDVVASHLTPLVRDREKVIFAVQANLDSDFNWAQDTRGCEEDLGILLSRVRR